MKETGIKKHKQTHKDNKKSSNDKDCILTPSNDTMTTDVSCDTVLNRHNNSSDAVSNVTQLQNTKITKKMRKRSLPSMNSSNGVLLLEHDNNNTKKRKSLSSIYGLEDDSVKKVTCLYYTQCL